MFFAGEARQKHPTPLLFEMIQNLPIAIGPPAHLGDFIVEPERLLDISLTNPILELKTYKGREDNVTVMIRAGEIYWLNTRRPGVDPGLLWIPQPFGKEKLFLEITVKGVPIKYQPIKRAGCV